MLCILYLYGSKGIGFNFFNSFKFFKFQENTYSLSYSSSVTGSNHSFDAPSPATVNVTC